MKADKSREKLHCKMKNAPCLQFSEKDSVYKKFFSLGLKNFVHFCRELKTAVQKAEE